MTGDQTSRWFSHDCSGSDLSELQRSYIDLLAGMLDEENPPQARPEDTFLTREASHLITVIPHKALDGVCIVSFFGGKRSWTVWAQVGGLRYHDDFDMGVGGQTFKGPATPDLMGRLVEGVRLELHRPIHVVLVRRGEESDPTRTEYRLTEQPIWEKRVIGYTGSWPWWPARLLAREQREVHEVTFMDPLPPPVDLPPNVKDWLGYDPD